MLYNLGIGAKASELPLVFEGADGFQVSRDRRQFRPRLRTHLCHL
jgi:hypothetical protein